MTSSRMPPFYQLVDRTRRNWSEIDNRVKGKSKNLPEEIKDIKTL